MSYVRVVVWVGVGLLTVAGIVSLDPAVIGLSTLTPVLQLIALRGLLGVLALAGAAVLLAIGVVRALRRRGDRPRGRPALVLGVLALLVGGAHLGTLVERGLGTADSLPQPSPEAAIDVLTLNASGSQVRPEELADLVAGTAADVVAVQEIAPRDAERLHALLGEDAFALFTDTTSASPVAGTALLVSLDLGEYVAAAAPGTTFGSVRADPIGGDGPSLLSVHPVPPVPGNVPTWQDELDRITALCGRLPGVVIAGDLNATLDHAPIRHSGCAHGAVGAGGAATWPTSLPRVLGAQIDHVLHDGASWRATDSAIIDVEGSDHRALLTRLVRAG